MNPHRSFITILFILLLLSITSPRTALADVAPPEPPVGSNLEPGAETTNVRMMSETVTIDVPTYSEHETHQATVTAVFQMRNLGEAEERMDVRFPLCSVDFRFDLILMLSPDFRLPAVQNFHVWADDTALPVTVTNEKSPESGRSIPCWANFPVAFPPGKDVIIKVQYIQVGGYGGGGHGTAKFAKMSYILFTGAGWKDTIGSADIIAILPIAGNTLNVSTVPEGIVHGRVVRWHFEDFEPGASENDPRGIEFEFLQPKLWLKIEEERANTTKNPQDGEAWGRLGKALKDAYMLEETFVGEKNYWESADAYEQAVTLLPKDADWQWGYAELLCDNAANSRRADDPFNRHPEDSGEPFRLCVERLLKVTALNRNHLKANELISYFEGMKWIDLSGPEPVILRPTPEVWVVDTPTLEPTVTEPAAPTATAQPSSTPQEAATPTVTVTSVPTSLPTAVQAATVEAGTEAQKRSPLCGAALLPGLAAVFLWFFRSRSWLMR